MDGSPDAILEEKTPFQKWLARPRPELPYDIIVFAKYYSAAFDRLVEEHGAVAAVWWQERQLTFYLLKDGRFAVITDDMSNVDAMHPSFEIWNWWDECTPDLQTMREKTELDQKISANRLV
ncbi:MAG: hypothetical protein RIA09_15825 [Hoeflea sp.]|jgi:hypothetical protein|uniref:hypothetical protein n=1 Tax=Hoeflea sp. TaxID=1940281 RepID=UPI0032EF77CC